MIPRTRSPRLAASIVAEAITPLIPGAGPPPTRIARVRRPELLSLIGQPRSGMSCRSHDHAVSVQYTATFNSEPRAGLGASSAVGVAARSHNSIEIYQRFVLDNP